MKWAKYVARIEEIRNTYKILVERHERKRLLEKHKHI
jgi:hypothetical protein